MKNITQKTSKINYSIVIFIFYIFELILYSPKILDIDVWNTTSYGITYSMVGFSSRALLGSLLSIFNIGKYILGVYIFVIFSELIVIVLLSYLFGKLINSVSDSSKNGILVIILLFVVSPASVSFLFGQYNFATFDLYLILITLITIVIIDSKVLKYFIPVLCFVAIATHQMYVFTYFSITFVALLIKLINEKNKKEYLYIFISYILVAAISFGYFQFFKPAMTIGSPLDAFHYLQQVVNYPISHEMIESEYYHDMIYQLNIYATKNLGTRLSIGAIVVILMLPLTIILYKILLKAQSLATQIKDKLIVITIMLIPLLHLPLFILTIDWGRWFASMYICIIFSILYTYYSEFSPIKLAVEEFGNRLQRNKASMFVMIIIIVYFATLGKFEAPTQLATAAKLYDSFTEALNTFLKIIN